MLLRMAKNLQCDIFPDRVRLWKGATLLRDLPLQQEERLEEALNRLLAARPAGMRWQDNVTFRLGNHLVNTFVVPWQEGISSLEEMRCYAQSLIPNTFPELASQAMRVEFETLEQGQTALAAAIEQRIWQLLGDVARQRHLRFRGAITPFQFLLQRYPEPLPVEGIFIVADDESTSFACRSGHRWQHVHKLALNDFSLVEQLGLVRRLSGLRHAPSFCLDNEHWDIRQVSLAG
ncbi:hypothetical protein [Pantoea endophytica]|uniref:hypothetical protein n=1 Tax=Pantoea endophytica TaxID=92488 RepID=UPI0030176771